jgi:hypothetical protein
VRRKRAIMSTKRDGGVLIWTGLACIVPVIPFYLFSQGALVITPLTLIGTVVLTLGLVDRRRSSPDGPSADDHGPTESPHPLPAPPPPVDD